MTSRKERLVLLAGKLTPLLTTFATALMVPGRAHAAISNLTEELVGATQGFQTQLLVIALALLGAGIGIKFLPTGSHRTKDAAGQLIDNALIIGGLAALGLWLVYFSGYVATTATGMGEAPQPGGPWTPPSGSS